MRICMWWDKLLEKCWFYQYLHAPPRLDPGSTTFADLTTELHRPASMITHIATKNPVVQDAEFTSRQHWSKYICQ